MEKREDVLQGLSRERRGRRSRCTIRRERILEANGMPKMKRRSELAAANRAESPDRSR